MLDHPSIGTEAMTLFLCGDVMLGRGIDQILPHPSAPHIYERAMTSALGYVELAERRNGPVPKPVSFSYIWGDALAVFARRRPDARIINLETSITKSEHHLPRGINYRMNPANVPCLTAAKIDCCALANNHMLDWGPPGLVETVETLEAAHIKFAGAGRDQSMAQAPAIIGTSGNGRVIVFSFGHPSSGIPFDWAAAADKPGVNLLPDLSDRSVRHIAQLVHDVKQAGDIVVASLHWGPNWGYQIPSEQRAFAMGLIDEAGVDVVHGHSSHHVKGIEVYRQRPIFYGCGDFLNDYEGISGYEAFRDDLALMYFVRISPADGTLSRCELVPLQIRNLRLNHASQEDIRWLRDVLNNEGERFGTSVSMQDDRTLELQWL